MKKSVVAKILLSFVMILSIFTMSKVGTASAAQAFIKPAEGVYYSDFGWRYIGGENKFHYGVDISKTGSNIAANASGDGTVITAKGGCPNTVGYGDSCNNYRGNYVVIRHNFGGEIIDSLYQHLASISVSVNQQVSQGQRIGYTGNSGSSTGQHLHFEIHPGGFVGTSSAVDPMPYLNGTINPQPSYHEYDGTWAVVTITNPYGGDTANLFGHVGYGIIGTLPTGATYKVYGKKEYASNGDLYYNVGPGYIHGNYGIINNHHAVVESTINTYNSINGSFNRSLAAGTYKVHAAKDGWYDLGGSTWVKADQIKVIKNP